ncbi:MAG: EAL domain-containing protein [Pseudomonadota bacterium]
MSKAGDLDLNTLLEAIDRLGSLFAIYDKDFNLVFANRATHAAWPDMYAALEDGASQEEAIRIEILRQFPDRPKEEIDQFTAYAVEHVRTGARGESRAQNGRIYRTWHEAMGDKWIVALGLDLTDLKKQENELSHLAKENSRLANVDELTGLANRRHFVREIDRLLQDGMAEGSAFCLGMMDLDGFKIVNDVHGHLTGDALLQQVSDRLRTALGEHCFIARLGGDEFALLIPKALSRLEIAKFASQLRRVIERPYDVDEERIHVGASMGFVTFPDAGSTRAQLMSRADFALYHSKQNDKGGATIFSEEYEEHIQRNGSLELGLRESDLEQEFYLMFQPIFDAKTGAPTVVEALARWESPTFGSISPLQFIPIAERSGKIMDIAEILFRKALETASTWPDHVSLSFNLSPPEVTSIDHARRLMSLIEASPFPAERVIFELTETAMIGQSSQVVSVLRELKQFGVRIALDDFGTGFSSLNYLSRMPLDMVKIDRSFLEGIETNHASSSVLKSICDLSANLGLINVIEGVETELQDARVKRAGINLIQGYLYARPVSASDIEAHLKPMNAAANDASDQSLARKSARLAKA